MASSFETFAVTRRRGDRGAAGPLRHAGVMASSFVALNVLSTAGLGGDGQKGNQLPWIGIATVSWVL